MCECNNEHKTFVKCGNVVFRIADVSTVILDDTAVSITDSNGVLQSIVFETPISAKRAFNKLFKDLQGEIQ